jgi:DNA mismatch repair endonuclease MutH
MGKYASKQEILDKAEMIVSKTLRQTLSAEAIEEASAQLAEYGIARRGFLGDIVEKYFFGINPGNASKPDFEEAGVELKTTPLKLHAQHSLASKERLVFSMINYSTIVGETWETSSFLKKNRNLLLMFYLWMQNQDLLDYEFKFVHMLDLLADVSEEDILQIRKDWEYIVAKIRRGEAHLLSEADTYYLGACTKAANSMQVREQASGRIPAKPRAFSFKQQYMNHLVRTRLLGQKADSDSIFRKQRRISTIESAIQDKIAPFIGKTDAEILSALGVMDLNKAAKAYKRNLVNRILQVESDHIEELDKANITLRVMTLEPSGALRESISFPAFDYKELASEVWQDDEQEVMADFHIELETKKFLFVIFQKQPDSDDIVLKKAMFWNFPAADMPEAEKVWRKAADCVNEGRYDDMPKMSESSVAHVRPHGKDSSDKIETPQGTLEIKRSFWLNAKYIQHAIENRKDQS